MRLKGRLERLERCRQAASRQGGRLRARLGPAWGADGEAWARVVVAEALMGPETAALAGEPPTAPEALAALVGALDGPTRALYEPERGMVPCVRELVRSNAEHLALYGHLPGQRPPTPSAAPAAGREGHP